MVYVEIIKRNKKEYFYLTKNIRISLHRWKKVRVYLGDKKPQNKDIQKAAREIEKEIKEQGLKKSQYTYLSEKDAEVLQDLKEGYKEWLKKVPASVQKKTNEDFVVRFTYNSNAIEGNRLTLRQTALILKDKVIPSGVRASDYNEAINGKETLDYMKAHKGDFTKQFMLDLNEILVKNTNVVYGGRIRFFPVTIEGSDHVPPKAEDVPKHVENMFKWYSKNKRKLHPFELAILMHHKIAWIHPFEDGNGRTARAVMNFILMKKGFPMFFIPYTKREAYYQALDKADEGKNKEYMTNMLKLIIDQIKSYGHRKTKK